jgi:hypothetical protein
MVGKNFLPQKQAIEKAGSKWMPGWKYRPTPGLKNITNATGFVF